MPAEVFDSTVELMGYQDLLDYAEVQTGLPTENIVSIVNREAQNKFFNSSLTYDEAKVESLTSWLKNQGVEVTYNGDGKWTGGAFSTTAQVATPSLVDSNNVVVSRGVLRQKYGTLKEWDGTQSFMKVSKFPASGGLGAKALYTIGSVGGAISAAATGISLGKQIAPLLYDAMPNFWENLGVSEGSFDPESWATLTEGNDSPFAGLFNIIFGIDPDSGQTKAYMDENAFAYMAYALKMGGFFDAASSQATLDDTTMLTYPNIPQPVIFDSVSNLTYVSSTSGGNPYTIGSNVRLYRNGTDVTDNYVVASFTRNSTSSYYYAFIIEKNPTSFSSYSLNFVYTETVISTGAVSTRSRNLTFTEFRNSDYTIRTMSSQLFYNYDFVFAPDYNNPIVNLAMTTYSIPYIADIWYIITNGNVSSGAFPGVDNQPDATLPDISDWNDIPSTLQSLQNQYPDLWNDGMTWNSDDPSSNTHGDVTRYIPVAMPNFNYNNSQQPVSSTSTQTSPQLSPTISDATLLKAITEAIQATQTQTQPNMQVPPQNPTTTGTGEPPALVPPSGSASALWSVYHPTQAQVNSFGAWLWTDNIITQIQQLLQNPMEGIITLHKVFAPPVDSGQGTIVVGRLDSNVPSATVNQQYVTVDCGEIDCLEQFGNVFDYSPFTSISIYLPFIGIAPLSVDDIMRSKIHVTYGVDVFTGVCLAMIEVSRDGSTVNMYQYAGVASVEYPLTGTVHNGLITGIMGIVGGFATIATAGAAAPVAAAGGVAAAGAGALATGRQSQSRSGNFSGNAGAMGIKKPYLIIERPQTKVADTFPQLAGYPTNKSLVLRECSGHVVVKHVHVEGINATQGELIEIENLLQSGVLV